MSSNTTYTTLTVAQKKELINCVEQNAIYKIENFVDRSLILELNKQSKLTDFFKEK